MKVIDENLNRVRETTTLETLDVLTALNMIRYVSCPEGAGKLVERAVDKRQRRESAEVDLVSAHECIALSSVVDDPGEQFWEEEGCSKLLNEPSSSESFENSLSAIQLRAIRVRVRLTCHMRKQKGGEGRQSEAGLTLHGDFRNNCSLSKQLMSF